MRYHGEGMFQWDTWFCPKEGTDEIHAFYLQRVRPGSGRDPAEEGRIGHAVSTNLLDWEELPFALDVEPAGQMGDLQNWTGSTIYHEGKYYMFYTIRSSASRGKSQRIGAAVSDDMMSWRKYEGNPIIAPDGAWYNTDENPGPGGIVDCRDLMVVKHDKRPGHFGVFATRIPTQELPQGSVFAGAYSEDLFHWQQTPPVLSGPQNRYAIVEMPDLFSLNGKWYLTFLEDNAYSNREVLGDMFLVSGTLYAVADRVEGPYLLPQDPILIASMGFNGFSCRTANFRGKKYVLYAMGERECENNYKATLGVLGIPKEVRVIDGKLCACYPDLLAEKYGDALVDPAHLPPRADYFRDHETRGNWAEQNGHVTGETETSWSRYTLGDVIGENFVFCADILVDHGIGAGLAFRQAGSNEGIVAMLDFEKQLIACFTLPRFMLLDMRKVSLKYGRAYKLRIVGNEKFIEVYLDEVLYLQFVSYLSLVGRFSLLTDRAVTHFSNITAQELLIAD